MAWSHPLSGSVANRLPLLCSARRRSSTISIACFDTLRKVADNLRGVFFVDAARQKVRCRGRTVFAPRRLVSAQPWSEGGRSARLAGERCSPLHALQHKAARAILCSFHYYYHYYPFYPFYPFYPLYRHANSDRKDKMDNKDKTDSKFILGYFIS